VSTTSGVLKDVPHSFHTRFVSEDGKAGTNPEGWWRRTRAVSP
jgi:osmotically inducible protein OsmC